MMLIGQNLGRWRIVRAGAAEVKVQAADLQVDRILDIPPVIKVEVLAVNTQASHKLDILVTSIEDTTIVNIIKPEPSSFEEENQAKDKPSFKVARLSSAEPSWVKASFPLAA